MTRLSCHHFPPKPSATGAGLAGLQLGQLWRRLALPKRIENWSLTSVRQRLVKTGGRLVKHARYCWLLLAESHLTRRPGRGAAPADLGVTGPARLTGESPAVDPSRRRDGATQEVSEQCGRWRV